MSAKTKLNADWDVLKIAKQFTQKYFEKCEKQPKSKFTNNFLSVQLTTSIHLLLNLHNKYTVSF
jgi:hypothetical protein